NQQRHAHENLRNGYGCQDQQRQKAHPEAVHRITGHRAEYRRHGACRDPDQHRVPGRLQHLVVMEEFLVPREREPYPLGIQPRVVEGINNDDDQRGIQKGVSQDGRNPQPTQSPVHSRDLRATQAASPASKTAMTVSTIDSTLPNGQSRVSRNCCLMTLPIMMPSVPPRMSGMANMPSAGMNTSAAPAYTPGSDS